MEDSQSEEVKAVLLKGCSEMVRAYQEKVNEVMQMYKQNPTYPFDFYNLTLREADNKVSGIRELYRHIIGEDLPE